MDVEFIKFLELAVITVPSTIAAISSLRNGRVIHELKKNLEKGAVRQVSADLQQPLSGGDHDWYKAPDLGWPNDYHDIKR